MSKKTAIINFKVSPETKTAFENACSKDHSTPSHELRKFVLEKIESKK
jgi:hypothetical protein